MRLPGSTTTKAEFEVTLELAKTGVLTSDTGLDDATSDALERVATAKPGGKRQAKATRDARATWAKNR